MSEKYLPWFAKQWLMQWQQAAPELARIRAEELRALGDGTIHPSLLADL
jgi:hypothetical protein